jgi:hypothetical protein
MNNNGTATYYMVEMDYPYETAEQRVAFDAFYQRHIDMLLTIPGFMTAQRFHCAEETQASFLALYRHTGPEVIASEAYTAKAGRMSVEPTFRAKMTSWDRNLVQGPPGSGVPDLALEMNDVFTLIDRLTFDAPPLPGEFTPLKIIGLDKTVVQRGVALGGAAPVAKNGWGVRVWRPIHPVRRAG